MCQPPSIQWQKFYGGSRDDKATDIKQTKDGGYIVVCPNFPDCSGEGETVEEAIESVIEIISESVSQNIKQSMKEAMREIAKKLPENGSVPSEMSYVMTKFPICLN